jgi:hypothetical protein
VQLFPDVPIGAQRFADLAMGKQGVAYRLSKFDGIFDVSAVGPHPLADVVFLRIKGH